MNYFGSIFAMVACIVMSAYFSATETALPVYAAPARLEPHTNKKPLRPETPQRLCKIVIILL